MRRSLVVALAIGLVAIVPVSSAQAVGIAGAKRQMHRQIVKRYYVNPGSLHFFRCAYRGNRNRVQCSFDFYDWFDDGYRCGVTRITYNANGYKWQWRAFDVIPCDGE